MTVTRQVEFAPVNRDTEAQCIVDARTALARSNPFANQPADLVEWLSKRVRSREYAAGAEIFGEGDEGNACFILIAGAVELVAMRDDGSTLSLAELAAGDVFGAEGLLTGNSQQSAALTRTPVTVLRIDRSDFVDLLSRYPECARYFIQLVRQRTRPARVATIIEFPAPDNRPGVILKDARAYRYVRLREPGHYLWTLMNGERTVRDLSLAYFVRYQRFGVDIVLQTISELRAAGFIEALDVESSILRLVSPSNRRSRLADRLAAASKRTFALPDPDRALDAIYRYGLRYLYSRPAQIAIALVTLIGFGVFASLLWSGRATSAGASTLGAFLGLEVQVFLHELAHSLTTKHFGREVHRVGIGWYLFLPIAFVDTSDIWLESRWRRVAVAAAGPYLNLVLAGIASCLALVLPSRMTPLLIAFAAAGYLLALLNLNPLYELDGYYVLSDLLNISNLRDRALGHLGARFWRVSSPPTVSGQQRIFLAYGAASGAYAVFAAGALLLGYHRLVEQFVDRVIPHGLSVALGWMLAGCLAALLLLNLWQGLRRHVLRERSMP